MRRNATPLAPLRRKAHPPRPSQVPRELCECARLEVLKLSRNRLCGPIPRELGDCTRLEQLNLSRNTLSGEVPASLANLSELRELLLDGNKELTISAQIQAAIEAASPNAEILRFPPVIDARPPDVAEPTDEKAYL